MLLHVLDNITPLVYILVDTACLAILAGVRYLLAIIAHAIYVCGGAETVVVYGGCKLEKIFVAGLARNTTLPILLAI